MSKNAKKYYIYLKTDFFGLHDGTEDLKKALQTKYVLNEKRRIMKKMYTGFNKKFCNDHGIETIHSSGYCGCVIAEIDDEKLKKIKMDERVKAVYDFREIYLASEQTDIVSRQIKADSISGSHSSGFGGRSDGYLGASVVVGAVSAQNYTYIPESYQLRVPGSRGRIVTLSAEDAALNESVHSSVIASILVGSRAEYDGISYRGIIPESLLYIAPSFSVTSMFEAVERCLDMGASVINYSAGEYLPNGRYSEFDRYIDELIYNAGFLFVVSAGNSRFISSPATCLNGITVGNADTKFSSEEMGKPPYPMFYVSDDDCSAFDQEYFLPNKPDIAAPGTFIHYINADGKIDFKRYGTSFAAPYVTGTAAQLIEKYPEARLYPALLKALLLCGANGRLISTENNPTVGNNNLLRIKSGAGFLDSAGALEIANYIQGKMRKENRSSYKREKKIYLSAGETLRVVLCYLKSGDEILTRMNSDNAVIEIYAPNGDAVAVSDDPRENVKLAEYTASYEGEYTMICRAEKFGDGGSIIFGAAWRIY